MNEKEKCPCCGGNECCPECGGSGEWLDEECYNCNGDGYCPECKGTLETDDKDNEIIRCSRGAVLYNPGCDHDWTTDDTGSVDSDMSCCKNCGISFMAYAFTECP